ncbi:MAG: NAD(P)/FAD-dependent oxidoreductase [Acidobacteriales bacterium]|nr:NAD(P)/FAD-dependent oxidoreductase [Terriglobales bacterium]
MSGQSKPYDVIVVGGGPAGCAAAITAKRGSESANVLLLEKGSYPRHKVCGEFVSPEAIGLLRLLIGSDSSAVFSAPTISRARLMVGNSTLQVALKPPAISLPRYALDAALWSAAQVSGVNCANSTVTQVTHAGDEFQVGVGDEKFRARAVINATGRWSNLSGSPPASEKWIGVKAHFAERLASSTVDLYFFRGGYCGVQPVGADSVNACAMVRADVAKDLDGVLSLHPELYSRSRSWTPLTETFATAPLVFRPPRTTQDGMLLVGDAAGFIDPFLGDGISLALRSGSMAGKFVAEVAGKMAQKVALERYDSAYRDDLVPAFRRAARLRRLLTMPSLIRVPVLNLARLPWVAELVFRSTRPAA